MTTGLINNFDPVDIGVIWSRLTSVADEMVSALVWFEKVETTPA